MCHSNTSPKTTAPLGVKSAVVAPTRTPTHHPHSTAAFSSQAPHTYGSVRTRVAMPQHQHQHQHPAPAPAPAPSFWIRRAAVPWPHTVSNVPRATDGGNTVTTERLFWHGGDYIVPAKIRHYGDDSLLPHNSVSLCAHGSRAGTASGVTVDGPGCLAGWARTVNSPRVLGERQTRGSRHNDIYDCPMALHDTRPGLLNSL